MFTKSVSHVLTTLGHNRTQKNSYTFARVHLNDRHDDLYLLLLARNDVAQLKNKVLEATIAVHLVQKFLLSGASTPAFAREFSRDIVHSSVILEQHWCLV